MPNFDFPPLNEPPLTEAEQKALVEQFNEAYPGLKEWVEELRAQRTS